MIKIGPDLAIGAIKVAVPKRLRISRLKLAEIGIAMDKKTLRRLKVPVLCFCPLLLAMDKKTLRRLKVPVLCFFCPDDANTKSTGA